MKLTGFCEDWSCPAGISCAHHFGRSEVYAGMSVEPGATKLWKGPRTAGAESCSEYARDRVKSWLPLGRAALKGSEP